MDRLITICAFRYALGRMTYVTEHVSSYILDNWDEFSDQDKALFQREIKDAIENNLAGHQCDIDSWKKILEKED